MIPVKPQSTRSWMREWVSVLTSSCLFTNSSMKTRTNGSRIPFRTWDSTANYGCVRYQNDRLSDKDKRLLEPLRRYHVALMKIG